MNNFPFFEFLNLLPQNEVGELPLKNEGICFSSAFLLRRDVMHSVLFTTFHCMEREQLHSYFQSEIDTPADSKTKLETNSKAYISILCYLVCVPNKTSAFQLVLLDKAQAESLRNNQSSKSHNKLKLAGAAFQ